MAKKKTVMPQDPKKPKVHKMPGSSMVEAEWPTWDVPCTSPAEEQAKRCMIPLTEDGKPTRIWGTVCVLESKDGKVKAVRQAVRHNLGDGFKGAEVKELVESESWKKAKLLETFPVDSFSTGEDFGSFAGQAPNNEFIAVMGGPFSKQLYLYDYLLAHAECFEAKNHNPLAKAIIDMITFFTMGKGAKIKFKNPKVQDLWNAQAKAANFDHRMHQDCDSLTWAGELMTRKVAAGKDMQFKQIDPSTVWEIVTNPADVEERYYFHRQFPTQYQLIYKPGDVTSEYIVDDIPAEEMLFLPINNVPGEKRGRSDLFSVLGWLKMFKDFYAAAIVAQQVQASYALRKTVKGNQADVDRITGDQTTQRVPPPGSIIVENESVTTEYLTPKAGGAATDNIGEAIRSIIATGVGLAPEYLGVGGKASTRATAITKSEPAAKKFEDRQMVMERWMRMEIDSWMAFATEQMPKAGPRPASLGKLKEALKALDFKRMAREASALVTMGEVDEQVDLSYEVIFPEISSEDRSAKLKDIATAMSLRSISHETASVMIAKEMGLTNYNYEDEKEVIRQELADKELEPLFAVPAPSQMGGGAAGGPGGGAPAAKPGSGASDKAYKEQAGQ